MLSALMLQDPGSSPRGKKPALRALALTFGAALASALMTAAVPASRAGEPPAAHGIAMHGSPALPPGFPHLPYANPAAPKGGVLKLGQIGTFDSLNPFIVFGVSAAGMREYVYESLLARSQDEPFSLYGLIARSLRTPADRSFVEFELDPEARFSDGKPITAEDVVFSWSLLKEKGQPYMRAHYRTVVKAEVPGPGRVRFTFDASGNREAPLLLGLMPILPSHRIRESDFERTSLAPPVGSGPYIVAAVDAGRSITLKRNPAWWAAERPVNRGRFNFDEIRIEYFRDQTTLFEAFKSGSVHVRLEDDASRWAEGYDFPAATEGRVQRREVATRLPAGMTALVMNTRRPPFDDQRVRQAMIQLFDFEWINRSLFHGHYVRTQSYFARSELAAHAIPASDAELELLARANARVRPEILAGTYAMPTSDGQGHNRANLQAAFALLQAAGYRQDRGLMIKAATGRPLTFEMMAASRGEERLFQAFAKSLERLGIAARIRLVDSAQRWARLKTFDFDMMQWTWAASLSPGNEQVNRWGSASATTQLSLNYPGVSDPAIDVVIDALVGAERRDQLITAARALDRLLLSGDYVIPLYHPRGQWLAHWDVLEGPPVPPTAGFTIDTWWMRQRP